MQNSTRQSFDRRVAGLAATQYGAFARGQLVAIGATRPIIEQRLLSGRWERLALDVYRLAGSGVSWHQSLMVACLAWGVGLVISHRAAAALWRLAGFDPGIIELTVPIGRRRKAPGIVHHNLLLRRDIATLEAIPVTTPARTLIDIAAVVPPERAEEALDDALRRGIVSIPRLRWRLEEFGRRRGVAVMRSLLDARDPAAAVPQSVMETKMLRLLRRSGLPDPALQYEVRREGVLVGVLDFAYPEARLAIETDGYRWHSGRKRWERDRARRNELTLMGWRIIHVTWADLVQRPDDVVEAVRNAWATGRG